MIHMTQQEELIQSCKKDEKVGWTGNNLFGHLCQWTQITSNGCLQGTIGVEVAAAWTRVQTELDFTGGDTLSAEVV